MGTASTSTPSSFTSRFASTKYIRLTTFRRNGTPVSTPVWFVIDGDHLLVYTGSATGKAKRLRHTSRVLVAPSDARGNPKGEEVEATARFLPNSELPRLEGLLNRRYGFMRTIFSAVRDIGMRLRRQPPIQPVVIEISQA